MTRIHRQNSQHLGGLRRPILCWHLSIPTVSINKDSGTMVLIGLGSSLGDRALHLQKGLLWMAYDPYIDLVSTSSVWQTMPIGAAKCFLQYVCCHSYNV